MQSLAVEVDLDTTGGSGHIIGSAGEESRGIFVQLGHAKLAQIGPISDSSEIMLLGFRNGGFLGLGHVVRPRLQNQKSKLQNLLYHKEAKITKKTH